MGNDISWLNLGLGSLVLLVPLFLLYYFKTGMVRTFLISFARMALQLILVGIYLKYIFEINSLLINLLWVVLMMVAASATIIKRSEIVISKIIFPVSISILLGLAVNFILFIWLIIGADRFFNSSYIIPITGMIVGNLLSNAIIGLRSFYGSIQKQEDFYKYLLVATGSKKESLFPFIKFAIKDSFSPSLASIATMGLIWLPGMMTGQILGGSAPIVAIKYQIIIMIAIFNSGMITTVTGIILSAATMFDRFDMLDRNAFKSLNKN